MSSSSGSKERIIESGGGQHSRGFCQKIQPIINFAVLIFIIAIFVIVLIFYIQWNNDRHNVEEITRSNYQALQWLNWDEIKEYDTFFFDIDGTLKDGNGFINGSREFIAQLYAMNKSILIVSNGDWSSPADKAKSLNLPGVNASHVVLPVVVMVNTLGASLKGKRVLALAPDYVQEALKDAGATLLNNTFTHVQGESPNEDDIMATINQNPDIVVVDSWNDYNLEAIDRVVNIIKNPAVQYYILSTDHYWKGGYDLTHADGGSIYETILLISGRNATGFGKPSKAINDYLKKTYKWEKAIMFGDNLNTDIAMANGVGMDSCLMINTGVSSEEDWRKYWEQGDDTRQPTYKGSFEILASQSP